MRRVLIVVAMLVSASACLPAYAACKPRILNDTEESFANAALQRLRPLGVKDLDKVGRAGDANQYDHWIILGMDSSVFMQTEGNMLTEIGIVLSEPANRAEQQKQTLFAAFTLARLSGQPEAGIDDQLHASEQTHGKNGTWTERVGSAVAVFTRSGDGLVIKIGKVDCD